MATNNDVTGDSLISKPSSDKFREGWDLAFSKKSDESSEVEEFKSSNYDIKTEDYVGVRLEGG